MVSYGVALAGLIISATLYLHVGAKYVFVRILSGTPHLQSNSFVHWGTWFSCTFVLGAISFVLAEAIPIFTYIIALVGSVCFTPLAMILPGWLWLYDHGHYRKGGLVNMTIYLLHWGMILLGFFFMIGATYGVAEEIKAAYASGAIGMSNAPLKQSISLANTNQTVL